MDKTGGQAFPGTEIVEYGSGPRAEHHIGMTLRDYFAATAPIGVADAYDAFYREHGRNARQSEMFETLATLRGRYADAMIAERAA